MHDGSIYKDPLEFTPERFLGPNAEDAISSLPFGFGRRICPGQYLADSSLFIYMSTALSTLSISKAKDVQGNEFTPEVRHSSGIIRSVLLQIRLFA